MSSGVIKAEVAHSLAGGLCSVDLRDIAAQAEAMLAAARAEADQIVASARDEARAQSEAIRQDAHREGHKEGLAQGQAQGQAAALAEARERFTQDQDSLVSALTDLLAAFAAKREQMYLAARRDVVVLAVAIARRIAGKLEEMVDVAPDIAAAACGEALDLVQGATEASIRAHPDDWAALEHLAESLHKETQASRHVRVVEDASVGRGGVIVETADSTVDATLTSRIERIADELVTDWRGRMKALSMEYEKPPATGPQRPAGAGP